MPPRVFWWSQESGGVVVSSTSGREGGQPSEREGVRRRALWLPVELYRGFKGY